MTKITSRDIEVFAAGAFALWGALALLWLPSHLFDPIHNMWWFSRLVSSIITGLALPLGVAILFGKAQVIRLTQIYLWLLLILGCIATVGIVVPPDSKAVSMIGVIAPDMLICIILLWLFSLSRSRRFRNEPDAS